MQAQQVVVAIRDNSQWITLAVTIITVLGGIITAWIKFRSKR